MRTRLVPLTTAGIAAVLVGCADGSLAPSKNSERLAAARASGEKLSAVVITSTPEPLRIGQRVRLDVRLDFEQGTTVDGQRYVDWGTLDPTIATVNTTGLTTGRATGVAHIVATYEDKADTLAVEVGTAVDSSQTEPGTSDSTVTDTTAKDTTSVPVDTTGGDGGTDTVVTPPPAPLGSPVELPRVSVDTRLVAPTGRRLLVSAGGRLQAAIDSARPGDVIALEQGATCTGHYRLRRKSGDGWITIRTAGTDASLPAPGVRMTPTLASSGNLPRLLTPDTYPAIGTDSGAHHYRIIGVEVSATSAVTTMSSLVTLGNTGVLQDQMSEVPHHLILDRVYVHGNSSLHLKRCVTLNSGMTAVIDSYLAECHARGQDSQAILGWNGPGPFKIVNNYLAGAGENVMFGGADPSISGLLPSDIEIRSNYVHKPAAWKDVWLVKNSLEFKAGQRILVEGNVFEGSWLDGQSGLLWNIKSANQDGGCGWCVTQHVTLRYNVLRNAGSGITVTGGEAYSGGTVGQTNHIAIMNNLLERINVTGTPYVGAGRPFQLSSATDVTIDHNLIDNAYTTLAAIIVNPMGANFKYTNNATHKRTYGIHGLTTYAPKAYVAGNGFVASSGTTIYSTYGPGNVITGTLSEAAQVTGTDLKSAGADLTTLNSLTASAMR